MMYPIVQNKGCMHACGHDGHTAILLGVAEIVHEHRHLLKGNVVLYSNMVRKLCQVVLKR